ncbi:MAG: hypothetical protein HYS87_02330 [Candidatus Colwellbacteria bacterium]|nr:hypothetical protein [Candidatus Colwellbacteria bacterium]
MDLGFLDYKTVLTIAHLLGVVVGMGGAVASDFMFFSSVKDERISHTEMRFLRLGSFMVWIGLGILVLSGTLLFFTNPEVYINSAKFLAKMTIVAVIAANGVFFHLVHIPRLHRHIGSHFKSSDEFMRTAPFLILSGVVSLVSWASALLLGSLRQIPYSYLEIIGLYAIVLFFAAAGAIIFRKFII